MINNEEFKKKLENILGNLYRIDREVREYLDKESLMTRNGGYGRTLHENEDLKEKEVGPKPYTERP